MPNAQTRRLAVALGLAIATASQAATLSRQGIFDTDDQLFELSFDLLAEGDVLSLRTYSWGGGTNAFGASVAEGGFAPVVTLFAAADAPPVVLQQGSAQPACVTPPDSISGFCWDISFSQPMAAGRYTLVLSQDGNLPGATLTEPFSMAGTGNYTAPYALGSDPDPRFYDVTGVRRSGHWALDVGAASLVPEPATWAVWLAGLTLLARVPRRIRGGATR